MGNYEIVFHSYCGAEGVCLQKDSSMMLETGGEARSRGPAKHTCKLLLDLLLCLGSVYPEQRRQPLQQVHVTILCKLEHT